jgi:aspartyl-tRNA(Asn)/glutamyl-tRNA(Gln) amidotransferase subunit B
MPRLWYSRYLASARLRCRPLFLPDQPLTRVYPLLRRRTVNTDALSQRPPDFVPLRKQLKEGAKNLKSQNRKRGGRKQPDISDGWELTVGIEIHAQLNSEAKLFSSQYISSLALRRTSVLTSSIAEARTSAVAEPNSNVALFDLAFPGSQPVRCLIFLAALPRVILKFSGEGIPNCDTPPRTARSNSPQL